MRFGGPWLRMISPLFLVALLAPASANANGAIDVSVNEEGNGWRVVSTLRFGKAVTSKVVKLGQPTRLGSVFHLKVTHRGSTAAHLDAVTIGDAAAGAVEGASESAELARLKLAAKDDDLIDIANRSVILTFDAAKAQSVTIAARIEPPRISQVPFSFPVENLGRTMASGARFYRYRVGARPGRLTVDGAIKDEQLGEPLFVATSRPGTGHPVGQVYAWVKDDRETLYVAFDFLSDNTLDGEKDYATLHVNAGGTVRAYRVSVSSQRYGKSGFGYTPRATYQHKTYEFAVPLAELGKNPRDLGLAFWAYGTAAPDLGPDGAVDASDPKPDTKTSDKGAPPADKGTTADAPAVDSKAAVSDGPAPQGDSPAKKDDSGCDCALGATDELPSLALLALCFGIMLVGRRRRH